MLHRPWRSHARARIVGLGAALALVVAVLTGAALDAETTTSTTTSTTAATTSTTTTIPVEVLPGLVVAKRDVAEVVAYLDAVAAQVDAYLQAVWEAAQVDAYLQAVWDAQHASGPGHYEWVGNWPCARGCVRWSTPCAIPAYICARESVGYIDIYNVDTLDASGKYQFLRSTWNRNGGYVNAADAPEWMQDEYAARLWNGGRGCFHWSLNGRTC